MSEPTGHECKCGKQAHYAYWAVLNDPDIGGKAELGWVWECIDCHFDRLEWDWQNMTCGECGYCSPYSIKVPSGVGGVIDFSGEYCRKRELPNAIIHIKDCPACPDCIPKEKPKGADNNV